LPAQLRDAVEVHRTDGRVDDPHKLAKMVADKDGVVLDLEPIQEGLLKSCPYLKVISRFGEGCDAIDLAAAKGLGVRVTRTHGVASSAVARHAFALILALLHRVTENDRNLKKDIWARIPNLSEETMVLGVAGYGKIGEELARLASAFGFKVAVYSTKGIAKEHRLVKSVAELARTADIISIHLALAPETKGVISREVLRQLKGKYLVNTARGAIVDEEALLASLERHELAGYATDVFAREPVSGVSKQIAAHPRVIASPHVAAFDKTTALKMTERALENAVWSLKGEEKKVNAYVV
jgi:phosphoglycerate dehydrogenase-like enzyme